MEPIPAEVANEFIRRLIEGESLEPLPYGADSVPWAAQRPLRWPDFLALLVSYCHARQWEIIYDSPGDFSLAIFAHEGQVSDEAEVLQGRLPFADDALPF